MESWSTNVTGQDEQPRPAVDLRRVGLWMIAFGALALIAGGITDVVQRANDSSYAKDEHIFDLSSMPHVIFFAGLCLGVLGLLLVFFGPNFDELYERGHEVTVSRRLAQVLAPAAAIALIAGCAAAAGSSNLGSDTSKATTINTAPVASAAAQQAAAAATAADDSASGGSSATHDHGTVIAGTATGTSPCEIASPVAASPGQVGAGTGGAASTDQATAQAAAEGEHGGRGMVVQQPLTQPERVQLEAQMTAARAVVAKYPTVKDAEAAGYYKSTAYVPCIGAHYTNVALASRFDPGAPSELLYDGTNPDSKIVGLSYLVYNAGGPPDGFAGPNDHWHQHNANGGLCMKGGLVVGGETMSAAQCTAIGGAKRELADIWMAHAWVVPGFECSWGTFAGECPELGGKLGGTAWDN